MLSIQAPGRRVHGGVHRVTMQSFVDHSGLSPSQILSDLSALASTHAIHFELPAKNKVRRPRFLPPLLSLPSRSPPLQPSLVDPALVPLCSNLPLWPLTSHPPTSPNLVGPCMEDPPASPPRLSHIARAAGQARGRPAPSIEHSADARGEEA